MMSFEKLSLRRAVNRAKQLHAEGDPRGARDELDAFVRKFPKSVHGWTFLIWAVGEAGGTIEDRLDVHRRAAEAVPYDVGLVDSAVGHLMRAALMIGDRRYLDEAATVVDRFEEVLDVSIESTLLRAGLAQLQGDVGETLALCERAEQMLKLHPDHRSRLKLGFCLASISGHETRGLEMADRAAAKLKDFAAYAYLAAMTQDEDPARAEEYLTQARRLGGRGSLPQGYLDGVIAQAREDIRLEREFLKNKEEA